MRAVEPAAVGVPPSREAARGRGGPIGNWICSDEPLSDGSGSD